MEAEHLGEYVAVAMDGRTVFASSLSEVMERADESFGLGGYVYRVGERVVGNWR